MAEPDPPLDTARRKRRRRLFAGFACAVGIALIALEIRSLAENGSVGWFWLMIGVLLLLLGSAEFLLPQQ